MSNLPSQMIYAWVAGGATHNFKFAMCIPNQLNGIMTAKSELITYILYTSLLTLNTRRGFVGYKKNSSQYVPT